MKMVPSLKYKIAKKELSQKKIFGEDRDDSCLKYHKSSLYKHDDRK